MGRIFNSPNPDFKEVPDLPSEDTNYVHPLATRKNHPIPVAFQITSPFNRLRVLLPHALVMHINPSSFQETYTQKVERFQTRGGWHEQHWGQDLTELSGEGSTGAFMNLYTGLSSVIRQRTIAWDRYRDLHDLYLHNGSIYDPFGSIVLQGHVMVLYDRGTYLGTFRSFEVEETADSPFAFKLSWSFKIEHTISTVQITPMDGLSWFGAVGPDFQSQNIPARKEKTNPTQPGTAEERAQQQVSQEAADNRRASMEADLERVREEEGLARDAPGFRSPADLEGSAGGTSYDLNINKLYRDK